MVDVELDWIGELNKGEEEDGRKAGDMNIRKKSSCADMAATNIANVLHATVCNLNEIKYIQKNLLPDTLE